jgi:hypothetical protein
MRLSLWPFAILAGLFSVPMPREAAASPVTTVLTQMASPQPGSLTTEVYYYRGRQYPYRYGGRYYRHRYQRHGRWHYY